MTTPKQGSHPLPQSVFDGVPPEYIYATADLCGRRYVHTNTPEIMANTNWVSAAHYHGIGFATPEQAANWQETLTFRSKKTQQRKVAQCTLDDLWTLLCKIEIEADDDRRNRLTERNITLAEGGLEVARRIKNYMVIHGYKSSKVKP